MVAPKIKTGFLSVAPGPWPHPLPPPPGATQWLVSEFTPATWRAISPSPARFWLGEADGGRGRGRVSHGDGGAFEPETALRCCWGGGGFVYSSRIQLISGVFSFLSLVYVFLNVLVFYMSCNIHRAKYMYES